MDPEVQLAPMAEAYIEDRVSILNACREEGTAQLPSAINVRGTRAWLAKATGDRTRLDLVILVEERCVGVAGLVGSEISPRVRELYVFLAPAWRGRGFGAEAIRQLVSYGFRRDVVDRIYLFVSVTNTAALRLYELMGFVWEGTLRSHIEQGGTYVDRRVYGMLRKEWEAGIG